MIACRHIHGISAMLKAESDLPYQKNHAAEVQLPIPLLNILTESFYRA